VSQRPSWCHTWADIVRVLKRTLEAKWKTLDTFEASVKKLEVTRMAWRSRVSIKDGELEAAKVCLIPLAEGI
jgi:hypothetical protein